MSVMGIPPGRAYNTQLDGDDYAMCVSGRLSVTPPHCLVDVRDTPEIYRFIPEGVPIVRRESIMKLARSVWLSGLSGPSGWSGSTK